MKAGKLLSFPEYTHRLKRATGPDTIRKARIAVSKRYPRECGGTIIADPTNREFQKISARLFREQETLLIGINGITRTPLSSYHVTFHGLLDSTSGPIPPETQRKVRAEVNGFFSGYSGTFPPITFRLSGYFFRADAIVMGLMPLDKTQYSTFLSLRRAFAERKGLTGLGVEFGSPDVLHITTAYKTGRISRRQFDLVKERVVAANSSLPIEIFNIKGLWYSEYSSLDSFPRVL